MRRKNIEQAIINLKGEILDIRHSGNSVDRIIIGNTLFGLIRLYMPDLITIHSNEYISIFSIPVIIDHVNTCTLEAATTTKIRVPK